MKPLALAISIPRPLALAILLMLPSSPVAALAGSLDSLPREGFVPVTGGPVWYRLFGRGEKTPLLIIHGGPGGRSCTFEPLAEILSRDRPVILYDQLGTGRFGRPTDRGLWTVDRAVKELGEVRAALGLERVHLYGHSWGSGLAVIEECGHMAALEDPERCAKAIRGLWEAEERP